MGKFFESVVLGLCKNGANRTCDEVHFGNRFVKNEDGYFITYAGGKPRRASRFGFESALTNSTRLENMTPGQLRSVRLAAAAATTAGNYSAVGVNGFLAAYLSAPFIGAAAGRFGGFAGGLARGLGASESAVATTEIIAGGAAAGAMGTAVNDALYWRISSPGEYGKNALLGAGLGALFEWWSAPRGNGMIDLAPSELAGHVGGAGKGVIDSAKFGYLFGEAGGSAHNVARTAQNAGQMARIGVYNTAEGRALLQSHFESVAMDTSNIMRTFTNQYGTFQVRESLFAGPGGFVKFESTWQVLESGRLRFTTAIPFGGS